jgi:hypothetical protein
MLLLSPNYREMNGGPVEGINRFFQDHTISAPGPEALAQIEQGRAIKQKPTEAAGRIGKTKILGHGIRRLNRTRRPSVS